MGNFSTCMAVIGGLNNSSILRLKNTKKEVDKKVLKVNNLNFFLFSLCLVFVLGGESLNNYLNYFISFYFLVETIRVGKGTES